jgi:hypothetical protein
MTKNNKKKSTICEFCKEDRCLYQCKSRTCDGCGVQWSKVIGKGNCTIGSVKDKNNNDGCTTMVYVCQKCDFVLAANKKTNIPLENIQIISTPF